MSPVCDGDTRPQPKQQTNKNRATQEKSKHNTVIGRQELRELTQKIALGGDDVAALKKTQATLERKIKSAETQSGNIVPVSFLALLEEELRKISAHTINTTTGGAVSAVPSKVDQKMTEIRASSGNDDCQSGVDMSPSRS